MKLAQNFLSSLHFTHSTILSINVNTIYYKFSQEKKEHIILILEYIQNTWDKICFIWGEGGFNMFEYTI